MSKDNPFEKTVLRIDGMNCDHCIQFVENALNSMDGIVVKKIRLGKVIAMVHKAIPNSTLRDLVQSNDSYTVTKIKR